MQGYLSQIKNIVLKFAYVHFKIIKFSKVVLRFCWFTENAWQFKSFSMMILTPFFIFVIGLH